MKYTTKLLYAFLLVFGLSSCGDLFNLDINTDPNNPAKASSDLLLSQSEINLAYTFNGLSANSQGFMGLIDNYSRWNISQGDFNGTWRSIYSDLLKDLEGIIAANQGETGSPQYLGIAQLLKSFVVVNLVDFFGDIPYKEALQGDAATSIKNPKFDKDKEVYDAMFVLIDQGIANVTNARNPVAINGDLIYGGNVSRWEKFGNTLKFRMYLTTRLVNPNAKAELEKLISAGKLITAETEDFTFTFSKTIAPDYRHPWYQAAYTGPNGFTYILHQVMVEMLDNGDPRFPYYFRRQTKNILDQNNSSDRGTTPCTQTAGCTFGYLVLNPTIIDRLYTAKGLTFSTAAKDFLAGLFGRDRADPAGVPQDGDFRTYPGVYPAGGYYDVAAPALAGANKAPGGGIFPIMTAVNVLYYRIEAALALSATGDARKLFEDAMRGHIKRVIDFGVKTDPNSVRSPITLSDGRVLDTDAYVASQLKSFDDATSTNSKLNVVMKQLWYSSWGSGIDLYNAFRRTGFPNTIQTPINAIRQFPLRLPYPTEELTLNPNAGAYKDVIYDRDPIFWDK